MNILNSKKIGVVGLGYVGLPLAVEFGKKMPTVGFDINTVRVEELLLGNDATLECSKEELKQAVNLSFTSDSADLKDCNIYIVTVPTPIDEHRNPNLDPLIKASKMLAPLLNQGDVVIYESTVYPGATEEVCVSILEKESRLKHNHDFFSGYSPERINPGDKKHRLTSIVKVTSGSTEEVAELVDVLYRSIIEAGTHKAPSIKVAEAAKVIENTQRDVNIALINELSIIFDKLDIDTYDVLKAAETKWNFLPFRPGLVGGHCIGVDPYYLTHKSQSVGYHPEMILAGRRLNDQMGSYVASQLVKEMLRRKIHVVDARVLVMGITFKENCPDIRNTKVVDVISELEDYNAVVDVVDPWSLSHEVLHEYEIELKSEIKDDTYDAIVLAVPHNEFKEMGIEAIRSFGKPNCIVYDLKYLFDKDSVDMRL